MSIGPNLVPPCIDCPKLKERIEQLEAENKRLKEENVILKAALDPLCDGKAEDFLKMVRETIHSKQLKEQLTKSLAQNYCTMCGEILDGYVPPERE